jgi:hypothetical protein
MPTFILTLNWTDQGIDDRPSSTERGGCTWLHPYLVVRCSRRQPGANEFHDKVGVRQLSRARRKPG